MKTTIIILSLLLAGCAAIEPDRAYFVKQDFKIRVMNQVKLNEEYYNMGGSKNVRGWCNAKRGIIAVPYSGMKDINGKPLPDFETLGHET